MKLKTIHCNFMFVSLTISKALHEEVHPIPAVSNQYFIKLNQELLMELNKSVPQLECPINDISIHYAIFKKSKT